ncbi:MAG TPA: hypothetical protein EYH32_09045 [Anaerolineae bacterium]|nr:hypothetical protein [Anaerolineae bacterium]
MVARRILDTPNLAELARKPVLIALLLAALDEAGGEALRSPAQVYLYATNALLLRNIATERTFTTTADKLFFLCELAWEMIGEDNLRIHYKQIPQRIRAWFGERVAGEELDHWDYDLRNQTLLQRTAAGEYEFAHKSLAEYFVACRFAARVGCLPPQFGQTYGVGRPFGTAQGRLTERADTTAEVRAAATGGLLSPQIREFVADMLNMPGVPSTPREELLAALRATMTDAALPPRARADAGLLLGLLGWLPPDLDEMLPVSEHLAVAKYPVTNAQFARFIAAGGYENDAWWSAEGRRWRDEPPDYRGQGPLRQPEYWDDPRFNNPLQPVVGVMWYEAEAYANWLSAMSGREVRLPTDDEWLLAAQGGPQIPNPKSQNPNECILNPNPRRQYPWGDEFDPAKANTSESGLGQPTPVGMYPDGASPCGVLDMAGNVWEWTASLVLRGGSWYDDGSSARCSARFGNDPNGSSYDLGFRLVSPVLSASGS